MKTWWILSVFAVCIPAAFAQTVPSPFANLRGTPVKAHYVRSEGIMTSARGHEILQGLQEACARLGKVVTLPPKDSPFARMVQEEYYTATHLIEFSHGESLSIGSDCVLVWRRDVRPRLVVTSPKGVCDLNMWNRTAWGVCEDGPGEPISVFPTLPQQVIGTDKALNCVRTVTAMGAIRTVQCVELPPEKWLSFLYRAGADRRGIVLESISYLMPGEDEVISYKAVEVRKNMLVGSDIHDLARALGYEFDRIEDIRR